MKVHSFDSTGDAYDACQCDDTIKDGDALHIQSEQVVGLADTWPIAVTVAHGELHTPRADHTPRQVRDWLLVEAKIDSHQIDAAVRFAYQKGYPVNPQFLMEDQP